MKKKGLDKIFARVTNKHWLEKVIDDTLMVTNKREPSVMERFYPSGAGTCPRALQFSMNALLHETFSPTFQRMLDNGNSAHTRYSEYFKSTGRLLEEEKSFKLNIDSILISGRVDFIITGENAEPLIVELKTVNVRIFKTICNRPLPNHFLQWNIYSKALEIKNGIILYECKDNQQLKPIDVTFDEEIFNNCIKEFTMIYNCTKEGVLVPIPAICPNPKYCSALGLCNEGYKNGK